ncbi:MAG: hypothetical protein AB1465_00565 [Patescibacteria group bacterium]
MLIHFAKKFSQTPQVLLRRCGYIPWRDRFSGEIKFIRRLTLAFYPRFHIIYSFSAVGNLILDLHLDSRRPMHKIGIRTSESGESAVVQKEAERIKKILINL